MFLNKGSWVTKQWFIHHYVEYFHGCHQCKSDKNLPTATHVCDQESGARHE